MGVEEAETYKSNELRKTEPKKLETAKVLRQLGKNTDGEGVKGRRTKEAKAWGKKAGR